MRKETKCVHSGKMVDEITGGVNTPIFTSSSFEFLDRDDLAYPRYFNTPNQNSVVAKLAALENAADGVLFSSGMAAMSTAILAFAKPGDHVVMLDALYGGTHSLATSLFAEWGIECSFTETDAAAVAAAVRPDTKAIVIESPTNPLLGIIDIRQVAGDARERGVTTIIDNTFATPINQTPIDLGIDIVVHSGTKYIGGHSDICCGAVLTATQESADRVRRVARNLGGSLNAMTCYLIERSLKTLSLRVGRQSENALRIASYLDAHGAVGRVNYPGLPTAPGHEIAREQMESYGGMLSFELAEGIAPRAFLDAIELIRPAMSLGGVETIVTSPAQTSHRHLSAEERARVGVTDSLLRMSVGVEHCDDLIADLERSLGLLRA